MMPANTSAIVAPNQATPAPTAADVIPTRPCDEKFIQANNGKMRTIAVVNKMQQRMMREIIARDAAMVRVGLTAFSLIVVFGFVAFARRIFVRRAREG